MTDLDLNDVAAFVRVVENSGFAKAARGLGVPTSTVSRAVARLEESVARRPRTLRVIYRNALHHDDLVARGFRLERASPGLRPSRAWRQRTAIRLYVLQPDGR